MAERVVLSEWAELTAQLRQFADGAETTADEDRLRLEFGSAHVEVGREGRIETGMPLHEFERVGDVEVVVDHDAGTLTIESEDTSYTFRRPGG